MKSSDDPSPLRSAVQSAADSCAAMSAVGRLYDELASEIAIRKPVCTASGRCCRFESYGHRMFLTTLELARFVSDLKASAANSAIHGWDGAGCPYQVNGLCDVHALRPLGCRIFFCDATATQWQNALYERLHADLRHLHESLKIPYFYVEWRSALQELGLAASPDSGLKRGVSLQVKSF